MSDWADWLRELKRRKEAAHAMGGQENIDRQHSRGRLTARERIAQLLDENTFSEYGALAGGHPPNGNKVAADGVVGGTGEINSQAVVVISEDFTVMGGSIGHVGAAKRVRLVTLAHEQKKPLIFLLDGAGERASNALERYPRAPNDLQLLAKTKGLIPIVALVLGASAGHSALAATFADFVIITKGSALFTAGPSLVKSALGKEVQIEELGGAKMHTSVSGVAHNLVSDESSAFILCRQYLSYFHSNTVASEPPSHDHKKVSDIVPVELFTPYDISEVLRSISDQDSLLILQPDFGGPICIALGKMRNATVMFVASQPIDMGGAITKDAANKSARFLKVAVAFKLPVIFLADTPGVMPGPEAEQAGTLAAAAEFYQAQSAINTCKIHVTLRKAFGFGSSLMAMNPFDQQVLSMAFPNASLGAMPPQSGTDSEAIDEQSADQIGLQQSAAWSGADNMAYDRIIEPDNLRAELLNALRFGVEH